MVQRPDTVRKRECREEKVKSYFAGGTQTDRSWVSLGIHCIHGAVLINPPTLSISQELPLCINTLYGTSDNGLRTFTATVGRHAWER